MRNPSVQIMFKFVLAAGLVVGLILASAAITSSAAKNALPGDTLYGLKTGLEQAQLRLSATAAKQARIQLRLSELRLEEMAELLAEYRYSDIPDTAVAFQEHIDAALELTKQVSGEDASLAGELSAEINQALALYAVTLGSLLENLPADARASIESALQSIPSSDDSSSDIGISNENDDDGNENDDDANENDDDANENDDDGNENDDDVNENDDDGNENDDDSNQNDDDSNENDDDANENDDDSNENDDDANENDDDANENDDDFNENDDDD